MKSDFSYLEAASQPSASALQRCFRAVQLVAALWTLLGTGILMAFTNSHNMKAEIFCIVSLLIAAAMYSVLIPLRFILKPEASK